MSEIRLLSLPSDIIGPFGPFKINYFHHQGQFVGKTSAGDFNVPFEIMTPADPAQADGVCFVEPQHSFSGAVARDGVFGRNFLFAGGASHATVNHRLPSGPDLEILSEFAGALRNSPHVIRRVTHLYAIGFSDSGKTVHEIYQPFGHRLFDLTLACTAPYIPPVKINGQKPIIVFGTENEFVFQLIDHVAQNASFPQYRWYTVPSAPHIPDTPISRTIYTDPPPPAPPGGLQPVPVAGTTPINWEPFMRALLVAGHAWVNGTPPPPSATLRRLPRDPTQLDRDALDNALGGIRHPALEAGEATFVARLVRGNWPLFGHYGNVRRLQDLGGFRLYFDKFTRAVESLVAARFLRRQEADKLLRNAQLNNRSGTFTSNYQAGLFV